MFPVLKLWLCNVLLTPAQSVLLFEYCFFENLHLVPSQCIYTSNSHFLLTAKYSFNFPQYGVAVKA